MSRHVTIGTGGHVDHGKTALVKALTGVDTDRWEEEKRRGITIDLGFAPLELGADISASIVDVPGHEDFVRNMVAGATGLDVAVLVIAADEGIMPQTSEHLAILELLGIPLGVAVITKTDAADPEWTELVEAEVRERLDVSSVQWRGPLRTSAVSGEGIAELRETLASVAADAVLRRDADLFRMPIDRRFTVQGAGTVVTGTVWSGSVAVGDEVRLLPNDGRGRVRGIQVHGADCERAGPGRRTALALAGVRRDDVERGTVAVSDDAWEATRVVDVMLTLLPGARPVSQRSRVRVHIGTAEVFARVTPAAAAVAPGETAPVRLRLEAPVVARWGDRAIVRSYSPVTTIGGCVVVDPYPPPRPRRPVRLEARAASDPVARIRATVDVLGSNGLDTSALSVRLGVLRADADGVLAAADPHVALVGGHLYAAGVIEEAGSSVLAALRAFHDANPLEPGMPREHVRGVVSPQALGTAIPDVLAERGSIVYDGSTARLAEFTAELGPDQRASAEALLDALRARGAEGAAASDLGVQGGEGRSLLEFMVREGRVIRLGAERFYAASELERARDVILREIREAGEGLPSQLREATGLTRKYLIPILEWCDAEGFTVRDGDARRLGPAAGTSEGLA